MKTKFTIILIAFSLQYTSIFSQQTLMWGITRGGGPDSVGTIFRIDSIGNNHIVTHTFSKENNAQHPVSNKLCKGPNGKLFGLALKGGHNGSGIIFEYDSNGIGIIVKVNFDDSLFGKKPVGALLLASNGLMYGCTEKGGFYGYGTLFSYNPISNTLTKEIDFDSLTTGNNPSGLLIQSNTNFIYGTCGSGGTNDNGVLFRYDFTNTSFASVIHFENLITGSSPSGELLQASNSVIYGVATNGGLFGYGTMFALYVPLDSLTTIINFNGTTSGKHPKIGLTQYTNGDLYGTTEGDSVSYGTIYQFNPTTSILTTKANIIPSITGSNLVGELTLAPNGKLYGITKTGTFPAPLYYGAIIEYDPSNDILQNVFNMSNVAKVTQKGTGGLYLSDNGTLLGISEYGPNGPKGSVFSYNYTTNECVEVAGFELALQGKHPVGLTLASNENFYGVTAEGGNYMAGAFFEFNPKTSAYIKLFDLKPNDTGSRPAGNLVEDQNGVLYGLTNRGGGYGNGAIYSYNLNTQVFNKEAFFDGEENGEYPVGKLTINTDGKMYGVTSEGGTHDEGVLFKFDPVTKEITKLVAFYQLNRGRYPNKGIVILNNVIYGTTYLGGASNRGVFYKYDLNTYLFQKLYDFNYNSDFTRPQGNLILGPTGLIYGTTFSNMGGEIFEFDPSTESLTMLFDMFNQGYLLGSWPQETMMFGSNGSLYGTTKFGGASVLEQPNGNGTIFEYSLTTNTLRITHSFALAEYELRPKLTSLYFDPTPLSVQNASVGFNVAIYPNPTNNVVNIRQEKATAIQIQVLDITGKVLFTTSSKNLLTTVDLSGFVNGVYLVKVSSDEGVSVMKVIKE